MTTKDRRAEILRRWSRLLKGLACDQQEEAEAVADLMALEVREARERAEASEALANYWEAQHRELHRQVIHAWQRGGIVALPVGLPTEGTAEQLARLQGGIR